MVCGEGCALGSDPSGWRKVCSFLLISNHGSGLIRVPKNSNRITGSESGSSPSFCILSNVSLSGKNNHVISKPQTRVIESSYFSKIKRLQA